MSAADERRRVAGRLERRDAGHGHEGRSAEHGNCDIDRTRPTDEEDRGVEIVVIPVPGDPRGIGRGSGVRRRNDPDEEGRDEHRDAPAAR